MLYLGTVVADFLELVSLTEELSVFFWERVTIWIEITIDKNTKKRRLTALFPTGLSTISGSELVSSGGSGKDSI